MKTVSLYHTDTNYLDALVPQFQAALPNHRVKSWETDDNSEYLLAWKPDEKIFSEKKLQLIFALGAGVDAFLEAPTLPEEVGLVRLEEAGMGDQMLELALYGILHHSRDMALFANAQKNKCWLGASTPKRPPLSVPVGVMGLGQLGGHVAQSLSKIGYSVYGYSRQKKTIDGVQCFFGEQLPEFLAHSEVLINLLPLTHETKKILNRSLFEQLPKQAYLINLARGKHLVEEDLISALDSELLSGALLDVFCTEPLPDEHSFWDDNRIIITPHIAAITIQSEAVQQISRNILAYENGESITGLVDRHRCY